MSTGPGPATGSNANNVMKTDLKRVFIQIRPITVNYVQVEDLAFKLTGMYPSSLERDAKAATVWIAVFPENTNADEMRLNYTYLRTLVSYEFRYSHGTQGKNASKDPSPTAPISRPAVTSKTPAQEANVDPRRLVITGASPYKTREDITRYAWSLTQHYPRSVVPSCEYENGWLLEFDADTDIEVINRNFVVQKKSLPPKLTFFHLPRSASATRLQPVVPPPVPATRSIFDRIAIRLADIYEYQISLDEAPFVAIIFSGKANAWKENFIVDVTNGNETVKVAENKVVFRSGDFCPLGKVEWTNAIRERIDKHLNMFARETLHYDDSTLIALTELIDKLTLLKSMYGIEHHIDEGLRVVYLMGRPERVQRFFSTFPHLKMLNATQTSANATATVAKPAPVFRNSPPRPPAQTPSNRIYLSREKVLHLQHVNAEFIGQIEKKFNVKIKFHPGRSADQAAKLKPAKRKKSIMMAIPKHRDDALYGSDSDSDHYYVDMEVDTDDSCSSLSSSNGQDENGSDGVESFVEIEPSIQADQVELIRSEINAECFDVHQFSFCTKYLPGLASLFETSGVYDADHYLAKLKKDTQTHIEYVLEEKKEAQAVQQTVPRASTSTGNRVTKELKVGKSSICLEIGDITKSKACVLVNSTTTTLDLNAGMVSKKLFEAAGPGIQAELKCIFPNGIQPNEVAVSTSGNLKPARFIVHAACANYTNFNDAKKSIEAVIHKCLETVHMYHQPSVTFPCIGAGTLKYPVEDMTKLAVDAIKSYLEKYHSANPLTVNICVYEQDHHLIDAFQREFDKFSPTKSSTNPETFVPKQHRARFSVIAKESNSLSKSVKKNLEVHFEKDLIVKDSVNMEALKALSSQEVLKVSREFPNCLITPTLSAGVVELHGTKAEVVNVKFRFVSMLQGLLSQNAAATSAAMTMPSGAHWQFEQNSSWKPFSEQISAIIENSHQTNSDFATFVNESNQNAFIDFANSVYIFGNSSFKIRRFDPNPNQLFPAGASATGFPSTWTPMKEGENLKLVVLLPGSAEYNDVSAAFISMFFPGARPPITKIERIQNKILYRQYLTHQHNLADRKVPLNETNLYHGTGSDSVPKICKTGFNRSLCGVNGTVYGQGVYFAKYSMHSDLYSTRGQMNSKRQSSHHILDTRVPTGLAKQMFRVKMLIGDSTLGNSSMKTPPAKKNGELYDSTHDPSKQYFVAFHDSQCYPEYLISYTH